MEPLLRERKSRNFESVSDASFSNVAMAASVCSAVASAAGGGGTAATSSRSSASSSLEELRTETSSS